MDRAGGWSGFVDPQENLVAVAMLQHHPCNMQLLPEFRVMVYQALGD